MNKKTKNTLIIFGITVFLAFLLYFLLVFYFQDVFLCGTYINNRYCTGLSIEEANMLLQKDMNQADIEIIDKEKNTVSISFLDMDGTCDFAGELAKISEEQTPFLWFVTLFRPKYYSVEPVLNYSEEKLEKIVKSNAIFLNETEKIADVSIVETEKGYQLLDNRKSRLNVEKAMETIKDGISNKETVVDLQNNHCYEDLPYTEEMLDTIELFNKVDAYQNSCKVIYDMEDKQIPVDASVVCHFIKLDDDNNFVLDKEGNLVFDKDGVVEFINSLAAEYDTYGTERTFITTSGEEKKISGGTYGTTLNQKVEIKYLTEAFKKQIEEVHTPKYTKKNTFKENKDIGNTYIEIDITNQKMYYYEKGDLKLETDVVTGNEAKNHNTPEGINYVYAKQKNRILRGPGYASFVYYWMPVNGGIGIHDATWRSEFGDDIYKTAGSHGCINTPLEKMEELYDMVELGTPVVMYY